LELDGHPVETMDDLHRMLSDEKVGLESRLSVVRQSNKLNLTVTPVESMQRALTQR
jgi:S1-C subfamily serine protease